MGEFVTQSENPAKKQKKPKKHKLQVEPEQDADAGQPATKLRKPQAPTKRSRKKLKQEERQQKAKEETFDKYKASATVYLMSWKNDKTNWKFSKNVQNWIVTHMYDSKLVPDSIWSIVLEYFAGSKGAAKTSLIEAATKIIETDNEKEAEQTEETNESVKQNRAKEVIQFIVE